MKASWRYGEATVFVDKPAASNFPQSWTRLGEIPALFSGARAHGSRLQIYIKGVFPGQWGTKTPVCDKLP